MCGYVGYLPGNPLIEVPYLVNCAANSHSVYPVIMKLCICVSLIATTEYFFNNNTCQRIVEVFKRNIKASSWY